MATTEPIRSPGNIDALLDYFAKRGSLRDRCFTAMGLYSALRVSDMLPLTWSDVFDFHADAFKTHISLIERKTHKGKTVYINKNLLQTLQEYKDALAAAGTPAAPGMYIFLSRKEANRPITRGHAYRIMRDAAQTLRIGGVIGCHSLRKTFGYFANKQGVPPATIMDIYNHATFKVTHCYLGIAQDERDAVYREISFT